jgi:hypothetical protein
MRERTGVLPATPKTSILETRKPVNEQARRGLVFRNRLLPAIALVGILYLMYSPVFLADYLMNDEWSIIGSRDGLREGVRNAFFFWGRSLFGVYSTLVYRFVGYDTFRIQVVRFLNFASFAAIAIFLFAFLRKKTQNALFSLLIVLFLFSQPSFQGGMAYSLQMISNTQPAMWLSLMALYIQFSWRRERIGRRLRIAAVFLCLLLAMQSTQTYAFFCMVPLAYLTLCDWKNQGRKIVEFLALASLVFLVSTLAYKAGLHYWHTHGKHGYPLGEEGVRALGQHPIAVLLHALNPATYWSAFEVWNYPFPFHSTLPLGTLKVTAAYCVMIAWAMLICWALRTEIQGRTREERRETLFKWLAVLACLAFGALFVVADSPLASREHRPHVVITFVGVATFAAAYAWRTLSLKYHWIGGKISQALGIFVVAMIAFGAQAGLVRGYVNNRAAQLDFVRTELMRAEPSSYRNIVVVLPQRNDCITEPCGPWAGRVLQDHVSQSAGYRYALATLGIAPESETITFLPQRPHVISDDAIVIDWQRYASARYSQTHLRNINP